jgi:hypothetical protein
VERRRGDTEAWLAAEAARLGGGPAARALATAPASPTCPPALPGLRSQRTFCVDKLTAVSRVPEARAATLVHVSDHALFYVTNDVLEASEALVTPASALWQDLADAFEGTNLGGDNTGQARRIRSALRESFGQETDYDCNGRVIFLFADLTKYLTTPNGLVIGFFAPVDLMPPDSTCTGTGSNGADMLFLLDPATFVSKGFSPGAVLDAYLPGTMAHELQHNVIFNTRCWLGGLSSPACVAHNRPTGDLWLNEGLSMVAEDLAGFGLQTPVERASVGAYLDCGAAGYGCYQGDSLTGWGTATSADPIADYGGAHAFLRWVLDQQPEPGCLPGDWTTLATCARSRALVQSPLLSRDAVASVTGLTFAESLARFGAGALFSGEDAKFSSYATAPRPAPDFSYAEGASIPWSPLRDAVGRVNYKGLDSGGPGFTTELRAGVKPHVAVMRFKGNLPK